MNSFLFPGLLLSRMWTSAKFLLIALITESLIADHCPQICTCDSIKHQVIYLDRNLTKLPVNIPQEPFCPFHLNLHLTHLNLRRCKIKNIEEGTFKGLGQLVYLNLASNNIAFIDQKSLDARRFWTTWIPSFIESGQKLIGLPARYGFPGTSDVQFFPTEALSRLSGINRLDLGHNPITYIDEEEISDRAFVRSPLLHTLDLHDNQILVLQPLVEMVCHKRINLTGNSMLCTCYMRPLKEWADKAKIHIDIVCSGPPAFQTLEEELLPTIISRKPEEGAVKCPKECICLLDYQHGKCDNKNLLHIPKGFPSDTQLLDLQHNELRSILNGSFLGLKNLTSLHLQNCKIKVLQPGAFRDLRTLIYLYLPNNDISSIGAGIFRDTTQLAYLFLYYNKFTQMPRDDFRYLLNLFAFHLQHNSISQLSDSALAGMKQLRCLYLTGNHIIYLSPKALKQAKMLEKLHLDKNSLQEISTEALTGLSILNELKLSKNPIKYIGNGAFLSIVRSLQHLYLDNMSQLMALPQLPRVSSFPVFSRWLDNLNLRVGATCGSPPNVYSQKVKLVTIFQSFPGWNIQKVKQASLTVSEIRDGTPGANEKGKSVN
uniref:Chondroadherin like n=1 Tax=Pseudonaja textilis TaxID=8673 RepID=A0A670XR17_PSETE